MNPAWRNLIKAWTPPLFRRGFHAWRGRDWFRGDYRTWAEAQRRTGGYDDDRIVTKVLESTRAVRDGRAAFERDGVMFPEPVAEPGLEAALEIIAKATGGRLRVLDFGGALGSTYWRHRTWLGTWSEVTWDVVEQPRFVAVGCEYLREASVRFFESVELAGGAATHDVLLASTVVQYLENPLAALRSWQAQKFRWLLFNNLPLHRGAPDRIAVQTVPPEIYPASYPVWFFNRERFLAELAGDYRIVREFASEAVWPVGWRRYPSTGLLLERGTSA